MKLGYSAWSMPMLSVDDQVRVVAEAGFSGIELICIENCSTPVDRIDGAERRRIREVVRSAGLELPALHASVNPIDPDPAVAAENVRRLRASIDLSADLALAAGPPAVVLLAYSVPERYEADCERIATIFRSLAEYAETRGVTLALELHVGQAIDTPEKTLWLLNRIDHPRFKLNLDTSHLDVMGYSIPDSVRPLAKYAVHTHVKDQRGRYPNHDYLIPGDGDYNYVEYLREMAAGGYEGYITSEISLMVQRKPGYDIEVAAKQTCRVLSQAFREAGLTIG
ncbi:MAG TPA: sugar phosphate isomerase/epimerase family protein [Chloroflexota bacterium]